MTIHVCLSFLSLLQAFFLVKKEQKVPKPSKNVSIKLKPDDESNVLSFD